MFKNTRSYTRFNFAKQYFNTEHVLDILLYILPSSGGIEILKAPQAGAGRYFKATTLVFTSCELIMSKLSSLQILILSLRGENWEKM